MRELSVAEQKLFNWLQKYVHTNAGTVILTSVDQSRVDQTLIDEGFDPKLIDIEVFRNWYYTE